MERCLTSAILSRRKAASEMIEERKTVVRVISFRLRIRKTIQAAVAVMTAICILPAGTVAQAAEISDLLPMAGWDALPQDVRGYFEEGIQGIPDEVMKLYKFKGGEVNFVDEAPLAPDGQEDPAVRGLYWINDHKIELAVGDTWEPADMQVTVAHEFGHFLYAQTYSQWSRQSKEQLENEFVYWKQHTFECMDEKETFAYLYSLYRGINGQYLSQECIAMLQEAEDVCSWVYGRYSRGDEIGPGIAPDWLETQ